MREQERRSPLRFLWLLAFLYLFFVGLDMMGLSFKLFGRGLAEELVARTQNPFVGLFIGLLATTVVQSSSTTTSITVGLVAAGALSIPGAIPIIMGANIGTSVTNTIVSLAHVTRRAEFRRAFAGATIHDLFNWMAVALLLPLEIATGFLARISFRIESLLEGSGGIRLLDPLKMAVRPTSEALSLLLGRSGILTLAVGIVLLAIGLKLLVNTLRAVMSERAEEILHRTLFRSVLASIGAGAAMTVMVQSSSVTTSVMVPLIGAGVVTLEQMFPFTLGANIGTTITAMLAALSTADPAAVTVAVAHLLFNVIGTVVIYGIPWLRAIPLRLARMLGDIAARNRMMAAGYILVFFYGLPLILLLLSGVLQPRLPVPPRDERAPAVRKIDAPPTPWVAATEKGSRHVR